MEPPKEPSEITTRDPKEFHAVYIRKLSKLQWWLYVGAIFLIFIVLTIIFAKWHYSRRRRQRKEQAESEKVQHFDLTVI